MFWLPCDARTTLPAALQHPPALTISSTVPFIRVPLPSARASAGPIEAACFATTSAGVSFCELAGTTHKAMARKMKAKEINTGERNVFIAIPPGAMQIKSAGWRYDNHSPVLGQQERQLKRKPGVASEDNARKRTTFHGCWTTARSVGVRK